MSKTHYKQLINPLFLGSYSLDNGQGGYNDITATISLVRVEPVVGADGKKEECMVMRFKETRIGSVEMKPMILNTTNAKVLEKLFKTPYIEDWSNRRVTIGSERVKAFGDVVDALRIRKFLPKSTETPKCADTGADIVATEKMTVAQVVAWTQNKFGRPLCAEQATKLIAAEKAKTAEPEQAETGVQDE